MLGMILVQTILISRLKPDADVLALAVSEHSPSAKILFSPAIELVHFMPAKLQQDFDIIILTSRHAAQHAARVYPNVRTVCVGHATAQSARALGLDAISANGTAQDVIDLIKTLNVDRALHLHGAHTIGNIAEHLTEAGIRVTSQVVYEQKATRFTPQISKAVHSARQIIVPIYSPRSAHIVSENLSTYTGELTLIAISQQTANAWLHPQPSQTIVASEPNAHSMLAAITSQMHRTA